MGYQDNFAQVLLRLYYLLSLLYLSDGLFIGNLAFNCQSSVFDGAYLSFNLILVALHRSDTWGGQYSVFYKGIVEFR